MNHETPHGQVIIEGPICSTVLQKYHFHQELSVFRPAAEQYQAILKIADLPKGRMIVARIKNTIIGYVVYLPPDPQERWSKFSIDHLIVLGAIEVTPKYRGVQIASKLLELSMYDDYMENYIIMSTEYYWHWDLRGTKLNIWEYRRIMGRMMAVGGLTPSRTDDPEINSHPANCLMVRIGNQVPKEAIDQFDKVRFLNRYDRQQKKERS